MVPKVYLEVNFLDRFDLVKRDDSIIAAVDYITDNKNQLAKVLSNALIYCEDISDEEYNRLNKLGSVSKPSNKREFYISQSLIGGKFKKGKNINYTDAGAIYLLDKNSDECNGIEKVHNVICRGNEHDFSVNTIPKTLGTLAIDKHLNGIEAIRHRCRNIVLIDPYIFEDVDKDGYVPKIPNVIKFLKNLYLDNSDASCYLTVITKKPKGTDESSFLNKVERIKSQVGNPNLEISVFGHKESNYFEGNRRIITEYALMDAQHVFDRDNASLSANFLLDGDNIKTNFKNVSAILDRIKKSYLDYQSNFIKRRKETYMLGSLLDNELFKD
ncbi:hypothetical protein GYB57_15300 [bacterium]|nr:hypothetical protein [bacterium]